jgi:hypothetical protein
MASRDNTDMSVREQNGKGAYVAGRTSDVERVRRMQDAMVRAGYEITFDWTGEEGEIRKDWGGVAHERGAALSQREIAAVRRADVTVLCWLDPMEGRQGMVGALIEAGVALGAGRELWVIGPLPRDSVFFHHPNATVFADEAAMVSSVMDAQAVA